MFVGCVRRVKKGVTKELFSDITGRKDMENLEKAGKNPKIMINVPKKSSEILGVKMEIFSLKRYSESWSAKFFPCPQTRRQVSAYGSCWN